MDLAVSAVIVIGLIAFRYPLFAIFTSDKNVVEIGARLLNQITPWYVIYVIIEVLSGALRGISDVVIPVILTLLGVGVLRIAWLAFVVPVYPSIEMVITNYPVTWVITAIMFIIYYLYRRKKFFPTNKGALQNN